MNRDDYSKQFSNLEHFDLVRWPSEFQDIARQFYEFAHDMGWRLYLGEIERAKGQTQDLQRTARVEFNFALENILVAEGAVMRAAKALYDRNRLLAAEAEAEAE